MQTYNYCNQAKTQRPPRYIKMTYKYLKEEKIKAVPFDKGLGFCLMSEKDYEEKLSKIQIGLAIILGVLLCQLIDIDG